MTKLNTAHAALIARLEAVDQVGAVVDPVEARNPGVQPEMGHIVVVWALEATTRSDGGAIIWTQPYGIDIAIDWEVDPDMTAYLNRFRFKIAAALLKNWPAAVVNKAELSTIGIAYPERGNGKAVVSCELTLTVRESLS